MTALATVSAVLAFVMEITKFGVLRRTSSMTVSVLGIVKVIHLHLLFCFMRVLKRFCYIMGSIFLFFFHGADSF